MKKENKKLLIFYGLKPEIKLYVNRSKSTKSIYIKIFYEKHNFNNYMVIREKLIIRISDHMKKANYWGRSFSWNQLTDNIIVSDIIIDWLYSSKNKVIINWIKNYYSNLINSNRPIIWLLNKKLYALQKEYFGFVKGEIFNAYNNNFKFISFSDLEKRIKDILVCYNDEQRNWINILK